MLDGHFYQPADRVLLDGKVYRFEYVGYIVGSEAPNVFVLEDGELIGELVIRTHRAKDQGLWLMLRRYGNDVRPCLTIGQARELICRAKAAI